MAGSEKSRTSGRSSKTSPRRGTPQASVPEDWTRSFSESADALENEARAYFRDHPAVVFGGAIGLGLASAFLFKKIGREGGPSSRRAGKHRASGAPGYLSAELTPALIRVQEQFDRIAFDGVGSVKNQIAKIIRDQLASRPLPTLGALVAFGYGLAGFDRDQLRRGLVRTAQLLAVKSLDGAAVRSNAKQIPSPHLNPLKGESDDEYDQNQPH